MKNYLLLLPLIIFTACLNNPDVDPYDDTEDIEFLEQYAQEEGVVMTDSGLMYKVIEEGPGDLPNSDSFVFINYEGESVNGEDRLGNADGLDILALNQLQTFVGLSEGIQLMPEGSTYEFVLPSDLALGDGRVYIIELELDSFLQDPDDFLAENAEREDITVTESGLQYRIIEEGTGDTPAPESTVLVRYTGTYTNNYVFDESGDTPATFRVNGVVPGFGEGLQLISEGATIEIFVPSDIGYGDDPPSSIIPGAILVFEVELLEIVN